MSVMRDDYLTVVTTTFINDMADRMQLLESSKREVLEKLVENERQLKELATACSRKHPGVWRMAKLLARFVR